jgi:hypothetical protein
MNNRILRPLVVALLPLVGVMAGCEGRDLEKTGCEDDTDCPESTSCNVARGQCICIADAACNPDEFCNVQGACQPLLECGDNSDCRSDDNPTAICDTTTGGCVTLSAQRQCVLDSQCPFGSICQASQCVGGCRDDGDCGLGIPCLDGQCDATPGACSNNSFCQFGQTCNAANRCVDHPARSQLCSNQCGPEFLFDGDCGNDECLIDNSVAPTTCTNDSQCARGSCSPARCQSSSDCPGGGNCNTFLGECSTSICQGFFCGATGCDDTTNPCPRGYVCNQLQIVSGVQCTIGGPSSQCGGNSACVGGGENGNVGFCSCDSDDDCVSFQFPDATCVNPGPGGACIIGTTCGPQDGLLCEDLR